MMQHFETLELSTPATGFAEITGAMQHILRASRIRDGLFTAYIRHTSASLLVMENADPDVLVDLRAALDRLAPQSAPYIHTSEGPDDMPAHIKAALLPVSVSIPVREGQLMLGTWQGVFIAEHRAIAHNRHVECHIMGE
ncbi:MAG: secondary thiamine-phosphate synthase enzyme YjbQ [Alphaproteobacteria bacterium]